MTEFKITENVKIVVDFEIGEEIIIQGFNQTVDGKHTIKDIKRSLNCGSGVMVRISRYDSWLDSNWIVKQNN